ncbi:hypothetical protein [Aurantiacibacter flavus]|uniref:Uncharacterized protein n=1 Tax=Aurantiacibacter flavus TaxID=3145232 RepID=A0ABV0D2X4_9SPHN
MFDLQALGRLRRAFIAGLASLALIGCGNADENWAANEQASQPAPYDPAPIEFFQRPAMLAEARASGKPMPLLVLIESARWSPMTGSDSPRLALYDDGLVIYRTKAGFRQARLNAQEQSDLLAITNDLDPALRAGRYDLADGDPVRHELSLLLYREEPVFISTFGYLNDGTGSMHLPKDLRRAYWKLLDYSHPQAQPWLPEFVEVMIWPYGHAREDVVAWPANWPGLDDARTVRTGDGYSLYLPSAELDELRPFIASRRPRGAIELGGMKWSVSFRYPFPMEQLWMAPNPEQDAPGQ